MNPNNEKLAKLFDQLAVQFKRERYRARAYKNAASSIRCYEGTILSGDQAQKEIKGVGKSIAAKIDEYLNTGDLTIIADRDPKEIEKEKTMQLFEKIHGVGAVTSEKWYNMGYRTLSDLKAFWNNMTEAQKLGYYYYNHLNERIPRAEMDQIAQILNRTIGSTGAEHMICGSYRRGEQDSGDIDCLIKGSSTVNLITILSALNKTGIIVGNLALGSAKYMGICRLSPKHCARRIDLMIIAEESWPYATLYFTGSKGLNVQMRTKALELGMSMNEYGMTDSEGDNFEAKTEQDIFHKLGMKYLEPTQRSIGSK